MRTSHFHTEYYRGQSIMYMLLLKGPFKFHFYIYSYICRCNIFPSDVPNDILFYILPNSFFTVTVT